MSSPTFSTAKMVLPPRPISGRTEAANAPFVAVDSIAHAASVIKSLRSSSVSAQRYQRCAYNQLIPNLPHFNQMVAETGVIHTEKKAMEAYMEQAIAAGTRNNHHSYENSSVGNRMSMAKATSNDTNSLAYSSSSSSSSSSPSSHPSHQHPTTGHVTTFKSSYPNGTITKTRQQQQQDEEDEDLLGLGHDSDDDDELFAGFTAPKGLSSGQHHPHHKTIIGAIGGNHKKGGPVSNNGSGSSNGIGSGSPPAAVGRASTQVTSKGMVSGTGHKNSTTVGSDGKPLHGVSEGLGRARPGGRVRYMGTGGRRDHDNDEEEEEDDDFNGIGDFDGDGDGDDEYSRDKVKSNNHHHHHIAAATSSSSSSGLGSGPAMFSSVSIQTNKGSNNSVMNNSNHSHNSTAAVIPSSSSSSSSTSTSRVVMKPGQRPFVRAGGSNRSKPLPLQTTTTT